MGKRSKRRIHRKERNSRLSSYPEDTNEVKFFLSSLDCPTAEESSGSKVIKQVKDCINEIYSEHVHDLEMRKHKRTQSKNPTEYFQPYNLVVNSSYQSKIKSNILELKQTEHFDSFKAALIRSTEVFVDYLQSHVQEFIGMKALLQAIIIYESFHTLQNSITQIGSITEDVVPRKEFDLMMKLKFKQKVLGFYEDLVDCVIKKEQSEYVEDLMRMRKSLGNGENLENKELCLEHSSTVYSDSYLDEDFNAEAFHNLPIDELVKLINDSPKRKSRKKDKHQKPSNTFQTPSINKESTQSTENPAKTAPDPTESLHSSCFEENKNTDNPVQVKSNLEPSNPTNKPSATDAQDLIAPKTTRTSKSRLNTAENSSSPLREEVDKEIESFRQRLELEKPFEVKRRPLISDEFLVSLRSQLKLK